jgi:hypothetical protein
VTDGPVNLNRVRKAGTRAAKKAMADANAAKYGQSKSERDRARAEAEKAANRLDQHRRTDET